MPAACPCTGIARPSATLRGEMSMTKMEWVAAQAMNKVLPSVVVANAVGERQLTG
jgi:hypothetical protein